MDERFNNLSLLALGLESEITNVTLLRQQEGRALYRVVCGDRSFVLKWFAPGAVGDNGVQESIEVWTYGLLSQYDVPTIHVFSKTHNILLLEDLTTSPVWRLATEEDNRRARTGTAVAEWYKAFHSAGQQFLGNAQDVPDYLRREVDLLDEPTILRIGALLGLADNRVWWLAAEHIEALKSVIRSLPTTLNYNDFHWTNLALSRQEKPENRAIVFDYHLLGIGPAYCDYRNVMSSLEGYAREAFQETFGPVNEWEAILDAPVSVLYSLHVALQRPQLPAWATGLLGEAVNGELELKLRRAIHLLE